MIDDATGRHPAVQAIVRHFEYGHLRENLQPVSKLFHDLAAELVQLVPDDPELTAALRHLLEAKDAAVRAAVVASE